MFKLFLFTVLVTICIRGMMLQGNRYMKSPGSPLNSEISSIPTLLEGFAINPVCAIKEKITCNKSRYRTIDGTCNNLQNPTWGSRASNYGRIAKSNYGDGTSEFPKASSGKSLPNPRLLSYTFFKDEKNLDFKYSLITLQWGQIITHDMSLTAGTNQIGFAPLVCCSNGKIVSNDSTCAPINIPLNDPTFQPGTCLDFERTQNTNLVGCTGSNEPAQQISVTTAYLDASNVYGNRAQQAKPIREFNGGRMKTLQRGSQIWPPQDFNVTLTCTANSSSDPCYLFGDIRGNQNTHLTVLQVILLREHNRIAYKLAEKNPYWNDETIFQETRRIVIAEVQHISYYEYLPILLGRDNMVKKKLIYLGEQDYINDYNASVNPAVSNEHATAAFRYFHSLIRGYLDLLEENRNKIDSIRLSDWFNNPLRLEIDDSFDKLTRGLTQEAMEGSDKFFDSEITKYLFRVNNTSELGTDLRSLDIQRGRDHGLGSYLTVRAACKLSVPKSFSQMCGIMSAKDVQQLKRLYETPDDVDLVVGASLERHVPGTEIGPTFLCILLDQFLRTRIADRFFYESNADKMVAFSLSQLQSIRHGTSMSKMLCDNSGVTRMQPNAFLTINKQNPLVSCKDLPGIDLTLWKEKPE